jgi:hypothetical protein
VQFLGGRSGKTTQMGRKRTKARKEEEATKDETVESESYVMYYLVIYFI